MANVALAVIIIFSALIFILLLLALLVFSYWGLWKMYSKAGQEGWKALIPYYNNWVLMVDIAGLHVGYFIGMIAAGLLSFIIGFIPGLFLGLGIDIGVFSYVFNIIGWLIGIVSIMIEVALIYNVSKKFNKGTGWVVLSIFFSFITFPLLGFMKKEEYKDVKVNKNSLYASLFK